MFSKMLKMFGCCRNKNKEAAKTKLTGLKLKQQQQQSTKPAKPSPENPSFTGQSTESIGAWLYESDRAGSPQEVTARAVFAIDDEDLEVQPTQRD